MLLHRPMPLRHCYYVATYTYAIVIVLMFHMVPMRLMYIPCLCILYSVYEDMLVSAFYSCNGNKFTKVSLLAS